MTRPDGSTRPYGCFYILLDCLSGNSQQLHPSLVAFLQLCPYRAPIFPVPAGLVGLQLLFSEYLAWGAAWEVVKGNMTKEESDGSPVPAACDSMSSVFEQFRSQLGLFSSGLSWLCFVPGVPGLWDLLSDGLRWS